MKRLDRQHIASRAQRRPRKTLAVSCLCRSRNIWFGILALQLLTAGSPPPAESQEEPLSEALQSFELQDLPSGFGDEPLAFAAFEAARQGKFVRARELAETLLSQDADSIAGHCLLGLVLHQGEGNLPLALYHLKHSRELFEDRYGTYPDSTTPWRWHAMAMNEVAYVSGEMGRFYDKIRYLEERDEVYDPPRPADRGWPLMRLRKYEAARQAALEGIAQGEVDQIATALTVLCAVEAELQDRRASYDRCKDAADHNNDNGLHNPTPLTNAAESALGLLRYDEAERWMLEASELFIPGTASNPWLDLTLLYLTEGRTSEALDAVRKMYHWRQRQPAFMDEQNRAESELTSAMFLLIAGRPLEASKITARTLERPDRTGFTSSEGKQMQAAAALVDRLAHRTAAAWSEEEASWSAFFPALEARLAAAGHHLRAWASGRQAASLLADRRTLDATLRPYLAGSVEIPEWIEPEITSLLGSGVIEAGLVAARRLDRDLPGAKGFFAAYASESALVDGRYQQALDAADDALESLPESEALLRSRAAVLGARAAQKLHQLTRAMELYQLAMQLDPGTIRRLDAALPAVFYAAPGTVPKTARRLLRSSPRFAESKQGGFQVRLEGSANGAAGFLLSPFGTVLTSVQLTPRAGEDETALARRLAKELHIAAFAPRLDLTQADIRTLDGSPTAGGGRSQERMRQILSGLVGAADEPTSHR